MGNRQSSRVWCVIRRRSLVLASCAARVQRLTVVYELRLLKAYFAQRARAEKTRTTFWPHSCSLVTQHSTSKSASAPVCTMIVLNSDRLVPVTSCAAQFSQVQNSCIDSRCRECVCVCVCACHLLTELLCTRCTTTQVVASSNFIDFRVIVPRRKMTIRAMMRAVKCAKISVASFTAFFARGWANFSHH